MDVASLLHRCRVEAGMSQRELADRAGTSAAAVCLYERGERVPRADTLVRLVAAAGASLRWSIARPRQEIDVVRAGRGLVDVLDLADALPQQRPSDELGAPVFTDLAS